MYNCIYLYTRSIHKRYAWCHNNSFISYIPLHNITENFTNRNKKKTLLNLSRKYILSNKISGFNLFLFVDRKHVLLLKSTLISKRKQPLHSKKFSASYSSANEIYFNHDLNKNKNLKIFYTRNSAMQSFTVIGI